MKTDIIKKTGVRVKIVGHHNPFCNGKTGTVTDGYPGRWLYVSLDVWVERNGGIIGKYFDHLDAGGLWVEASQVERILEGNDAKR